MKKYRKERKGKKIDINKDIRKALSCGEIVSSISRRGSGDLFVKYTRTFLNNSRYYGIWERDLLEGKWHLLQFGGKQEVEPGWKEFVNSWKDNGYNNIKLIA